MSSRNTSIDIGRFIASFLIVAIHTTFPIRSLSAFIIEFVKIGVPFFYMISGFYIYSADNRQVADLALRSLKKVISILLTVLLVYFLLYLFESKYANGSSLFQQFRVIPFFLFNDFYFTGHLWYLFSYVYVLILVFFFAKFNFTSLISYMLPLLIIIYFTSTLWSRTISIDNGKFLFELNWLVLGLPFFAIGFFFKQNIEYIKFFKKKYLIYIISILSFFMFVEHFLFKKIIGHGPGIFSSFFLACFCFLYCLLNFPIIGNNKLAILFSKIGRKNSLDIYLYHILIREILTYFSSNIYINNTISVFLLSLLFSFLLNFLKDIDLVKIFKYNK